MNQVLHKTAALLLSGVLSLSLLAGCAGTPPASTDASTSPISESEVSQNPSSQVSQGSAASSDFESSQSSGTPQGSSEASAPNTSTPADTASESEGKVLVVYFSATGNTKAVAEVIAAEMDSELYEIAPETPYTSEDLDWTVQTSRSSKEHEDPSIRPAIVGGTKDLSGYDTIFVGYPLWWGEAPNIVWNFVENSALRGKTVIPFATSTSSGFGSSGETLAGLAPDANWLDGQRFPSDAPEADVQSWVSGLNLNH